jgi:hypothetical protein
LLFAVAWLGGLLLSKGLGNDTHLIAFTFIFTPTCVAVSAPLDFSKPAYYIEGLTMPIKQRAGAGCEAEYNGGLLSRGIGHILRKAIAFVSNNQILLLELEKLQRLCLMLLALARLQRAPLIQIIGTME